MLAKLHQPVAKTATVGAASVIGEEELSKEGFAVGLLARRVDRLSQICTELESHPPLLTAHGCYLGGSFGGLPPSCPCACAESGARKGSSISPSQLLVRAALPSRRFWKTWSRGLANLFSNGIII